MGCFFVGDTNANSLWLRTHFRVASSQKRLLQAGLPSTTVGGYQSSYVHFSTSIENPNTKHKPAGPEVRISQKRWHWLLGYAFSSTNAKQKSNKTAKEDTQNEEMAQRTGEPQVTKKDILKRDFDLEQEILPI